MNSLMMLLTTFAVGLSGPEGGTVYVPRTEVRETTALVPRVIYDEVKVNESFTVYDPYHYELVPGASPLQHRSIVHLPRLVRPVHRLHLRRTH